MRAEVKTLVSVLVLEVELKLSIVVLIQNEGVQNISIYKEATNRKCHLIVRYGSLR